MHLAPCQGEMSLFLVGWRQEGTTGLASLSPPCPRREQLNYSDLCSHYNYLTIWSSNNPVLLLSTLTQKTTPFGLRFRAPHLAAFSYLYYIHIFGFYITFITYMALGKKKIAKDVSKFSLLCKCNNVRIWLSASLQLMVSETRLQMKAER